MACSKLLFLVLALLPSVAIGAACEKAVIDSCERDAAAVVITIPLDGHMPATMTQSEWANSCKVLQTGVTCFQNMDACTEKGIYETYYSNYRAAMCDMDYGEYKEYYDCITEKVPFAEFGKCSKDIDENSFNCSQYQYFLGCVGDQVNCHCGADTARMLKQAGAPLLVFRAALYDGSKCELDMSFGDLDCTDGGKAPVIATMWLISGAVALVALVA